MLKDKSRTVFEGFCQSENTVGPNSTSHDENIIILRKFIKKSVVIIASGCTTKVYWKFQSVPYDWTPWFPIPESMYLKGWWNTQNEVGGMDCIA